MYSASIHIAHAHANERLKDMYVEAANERLVNESARANRSRRSFANAAGNVRHNLGVALVRAGHRLQHSAAPDRPAGAPGARLGPLWTAR